MLNHCNEREKITFSVFDANYLTSMGKNNFPANSYSALDKGYPCNAKSALFFQLNCLESRNYILLSSSKLKCQCFVPETLFWADSSDNILTALRKLKVFYSVKDVPNRRVCFSWLCSQGIILYSKEVLSFFFLIYLMHSLWKLAAVHSLGKKKTKYKCSFLLVRWSNW